MIVCVYVARFCTGATHILYTYIHIGKTNLKKTKEIKAGLFARTAETICAHCQGRK